MAAGLICYFVVEGEPYPFESDSVGEFGDGDHGEVPKEVAEDLFPYHVPRWETLSWIYARIPEANCVSAHPRQLVVELDKTDNISFSNQVEQLPGHFGRLSVGYINGDIQEFASTALSKRRVRNS